MSSRIFLVLLTLFAAGCGGDHGGTPSGGTALPSVQPTPSSGRCLSDYLNEEDRKAIARQGYLSDLVLEAARITSEVSGRIGAEKTEEMIRFGLIGEWVANPQLNCLNTQGVSL